MTFKTFRSIPFLVLSILFAACETSDDSSVISGVDINGIRATATSGNWSVVLYEEDGIDQTSNFLSFSFSFNSDGVLSATNGNDSISGAWSITADSSSSDDDSSDDDVDFNIFFTAPSNFEELSEDWEIVSYSNTRMDLRHVSGGDGSLDRLIFERL